MTGFWRLKVCLAVLVLGPTAAAAQVDRSQLAAVSHPPLEGIDAAVREQLESARGALDGELADPQASDAQLGRAFLDMGSLYLVYDLSPSSQQCLANAALLLPDDVTAPYLLGTYYEQDGDLEAARQAYQSARRLRADYLPILVRLADVHLLLGELDMAREVLEAAAESHPRAAPVLYGRARLAAAEGRHADAVADFEAALEAQPRATALHYQLAQAYRQLGQTDKAREHLAQRGEVEVRYPDPIADSVLDLATGVGVELLLIDRALEQGDFDQAEARIRHVLELEPDNARAHYSLGVVLMRLDRPLEALESLTRAVELEPERLGRRMVLVGALLALERQDDAVLELQSIIARSPDYVDARVELAGIMVRRGELEKSAKLYSEALEYQPSNNGIRWQLVLNLERLDRRPEARAHLETILETEEDFANAHFKMGNYEFEAGNPLEAQIHYGHAVRLDPDLREAHLNLAILLARKGDYVGAADHQERVVALDPTDAEAHLTLGTMRILGSDYAAARSGLEAALSLHSSDPRIADLLARLLATAPVAEVRDGATAVDIAGKVLEAFPTPDHAQTVAMGLAEMGRFEDAAQLQEQIIVRIKEAEGGKGLAVAEKRLALYRAGEAVREAWLDG